ncbi:MAG: F-box protein [Alphaproteobacteria bacterium]|nr:F-box protein [Alphaproteobacteria bacterium]
MRKKILLSLIISGSLLNAYESLNSSVTPLGKGLYNRFPNELKIEIINKLDRQDLVNLALASKKMNRVVCQLDSTIRALEDTYQDFCATSDATYMEGFSLGLCEGVLQISDGNLGNISAAEINFAKLKAAYYLYGHRHEAQYKNLFLQYFNNLSADHKEYYKELKAWVESN